MNQSAWEIAGKTCMITGASSGIGKVTALELARRGAHLVLVCRDRGRGEAALTEIRSKTGNDKIDLMLTDLGSLQQIRAFARDYLATNRPLHVMINNAGIMNTRRILTVDGHESTFAVNHLGYFLPTLLLLERIKQSAPARIINVASTMHQMGTIDFDDLMAERKYRSMAIYGRSKLANIMFTYELASRLEGTGVTVNCLHPGGVATNIAYNNGPLMRAIMYVSGFFLRTPEQGAETSIYLATSPAVQGVTGKYLVDCKEKRTSSESYDKAKWARLWRVSERLTGLISSEASAA